VRRPDCVKRDIQSVSARRTELWRQLAQKGEKDRRAELHAVNTKLSELWLELRQVSARIRAGSPERIIASARRVERAEREQRRRVAS
jgi:hypothetical protein